jgi:hypothetical protein
VQDQTLQLAGASVVLENLRFAGGNGVHLILGIFAIFA